MLINERDYADRSGNLVTNSVFSSCVNVSALQSVSQNIVCIY